MNKEFYWTKQLSNAIGCLILMNIKGLFSGKYYTYKKVKSEINNNTWYVVYEHSIN